jgi:hypothetical protein
MYLREKQFRPDGRTDGRACNPIAAVVVSGSRVNLDAKHAEIFRPIYREKDY